MLVSKNRAPGIGLVPIETEALGERLPQRAQPLQSLFPAAITADFKPPRLPRSALVP